MENQEHEEITRDEIKKEFQLERMILFSDAVFAIVITLMAMDIKLPPESGKEAIAYSYETFSHLGPSVFAYCISFLFIGTIWFQHLTMFSLLKDYDKGLVVRNLLLLFLIGLFPFSASIIARANGAMLPFFIYMGIILLCILAQYMLHRYILIERPALRVKANIEEQLNELFKRKVSLISISSLFILIIISWMLITDPEKKPLAILWMVLFPLIYKLVTKRK